ncbi:hypothetical protein AB0L20_23525, partial [Streptomyces albidoflavus]|uniref:hypothetical protein n=1 Tax=Streptomyces albidoflavus TaxID=1886 RepID=UPI00341271AE
IPLLGTPAPEGARDWAGLVAADTEPVFTPVPRTRGVPRVPGRPGAQRGSGWGSGGAGSG